MTDRSKSNAAFGKEKVLQYNHLLESMCCFLGNTSKTQEPRNFSEAFNDKDWVNAMQTEIQALQDNGTCLIVDLPPGKRAIGCKWVYKIKYNSDDSLEHYKARLAAKGYILRSKKLTLMKHFLL